MAGYHVSCGYNAIFAGTTNKNCTMLVRMSDVTAEALAASAQFMMMHPTMKYEFEYNGKTYRMAVTALEEHDEKDA